MAKGMVVDRVGRDYENLGRVNRLSHIRLKARLGQLLTSPRYTDHTRTQPEIVVLIGLSILHIVMTHTTILQTAECIYVFTAMLEIDRITNEFVLLPLFSSQSILLWLTNFQNISVYMSWWFQKKWSRGTI